MSALPASAHDTAETEVRMTDQARPRHPEAEARRLVGPRQPAPGRVCRPDFGPFHPAGVPGLAAVVAGSFRPPAGVPLPMPASPR